MAGWPIEEVARVMGVLRGGGRAAVLGRGRQDGMCGTPAASRPRFVPHGSSETEIVVN